MLKKAIFISLSTLFFASYTFAASNDVVSSMYEAYAEQNPEVINSLQKEWATYQSALQKYAERVQMQDKQYYDAAVQWTKVNQTSPTTAMELFAQALRNANDMGYFSLTGQFRKDILEAVIAQFFDAYTLTMSVNNLSAREVSQSISLYKQALFSPRSQYKNIKPVTPISWEDSFALWKATPKTIELLDPDYVRKGYHPANIGNLTILVTLATIKAKSTEESAYKDYVTRFNKDPMNRMKGNKPLSLNEFLKSQLEVSYAQAESRNAFVRKFNEDTRAKVRQSITDYAMMKTNKLELPDEVAEYLNS